MLDVINCDKDEFSIRFSRDLKSNLIGTNCNPKLLYKYELKAWKTDSILQLKQAATMLDGSSPEKDTKTVEVLYDMGKNLLLNADGTIMTTDRSRYYSKSYF